MTNSENASVLVTVLAVLAALSILLLAALTFALSRYAVHQRDLNRQGAVWLAETGITRVLMALGETQPDGLLPIDSLQTPNGGTVSYQTLYWGPLLLAIAEGRLGSQVVHRTALIGSWVPGALAPAVTVGDETLPLTVTGSTTITGDAVTGSAGVVEGRLNGMGVVYPDFLHGANVVQPLINLPSIDRLVLGQFFIQVARYRDQRDIVWPGSRLLCRDDRLPTEGGPIYVENNLILNGVADRYKSAVRVIVVGGSVDITGETYLRTPVQIIADGHIRVGSRAIVDGALLYARDSIIFTDTCNFSGTALSPHRIATYKAAALQYPAILSVYSDNASSCDTAMVALYSTRPAEATLCALRMDSASSLRQAAVYLDTAVNLWGCVLSEGVTDLRGTVWGSVLTEQFVYDLAPTTYVNWLRDCRVDRSRLTYHPAIPAVANSAGRRSPRILREDGDG